MATAKSDSPANEVYDERSAIKSSFPGSDSTEGQRSSQRKGRFPWLSAFNCWYFPKRYLLAIMAFFGFGE